MGKLRGEKDWLNHHKQDASIGRHPVYEGLKSFLPQLELSSFGRKMVIGQFPKNIRKFVSVNPILLKIGLSCRAAQADQKSGMTLKNPSSQSKVRLVQSLRVAE